MARFGLVCLPVIHLYTGGQDALYRLYHSCGMTEDSQSIPKAFVSVAALFVRYQSPPLSLRHFSAMVAHAGAHGVWSPGEDMVRFRGT